ncbi:AraC family transcriptional regulator [Halomonas elongata]|uniref:Urease operon transcriptional activator n=1 Tax=Halomonas elongata TaxID=2746 RepID=A0A1B8NVD6_HALEL|nr:helix-turn-helix transcriptional regulator [Halomonas elongata]OBX33928.1 urease operon transcriptional activator [Halomonas elongata]RAW07614.1 AraC family transcriptional regulator [Halomonas elongata]
MTNLSAERQRVRAHTSQDLRAYGRHYGIDYHFPHLDDRPRTVLHGRVQELTPGPGMQLVASDIEVLERYDSRSRVPAPLSIIVMLEGEAEVSLAQHRLTLRPGMALSVQLDDRHGLGAVQPAGQRIRALTLGLDESRLAALVGESVPYQGSRMRAWRLPATLRSALDEAIDTPLGDTAQRLQLEGLSLQLLAHGLPDTRQASPPATAPPPGERQRLERVREALRADPTREHRLESLARLAAMSPASLRRKYRAAFGKSVFDDLREYRLSLARDYLTRGFSVQQAAHFCGYRHASNFATAFRRHYGVAPSSLAEHL